METCLNIACAKEIKKGDLFCSDLCRSEQHVRMERSGSFRDSPVAWWNGAAEESSPQLKTNKADCFSSELESVQRRSKTLSSTLPYAPSPNCSSQLGPHDFGLAGMDGE